MAVKKKIGRFITSRVAFMDLDAVDQVGKEAKRMGAKHVLLLTEKGLSKAAVAEQIRKLVEAEGVQVVAVHEAKRNRYVTTLAAGMRIYQIDQSDMTATDKDIDIFLL